MKIYENMIEREREREREREMWHLGHCHPATGAAVFRGKPTHMPAVIES